jgi:serine phosphatase RsbU (regulator of sigma subunit)
VGSGFDQKDRRALLVGALALAILAVTYPIVAEAAARPLAVFMLPCLLTAVLAGWRSTLLVGIACLGVAIVQGVIGPLDKEALLARWSVISAGIVVGAVGAVVRERQSGRLVQLSATLTVNDAFERALAPAPITPDGFVAVARLRPAEPRMHLGGDFVEAIALPDGRMAVLIGDVCGHGPQQAAVGAALRAGWKSIALSDKRDPADWVDALNASFFRDGRIDTYVTLCTGYLDRLAGVTRLVSAGHPPPLSLQPVVTAVGLAPAPPLGLGFEEVWTAADIRWAGEPLLFYTDGLTDAPLVDGPPNRWGDAGLISWLQSNPRTGGLDEFVERLLSAASFGRVVRDDVAVLVVATG